MRSRRSRLLSAVLALVVTSQIAGIDASSLVLLESNRSSVPACLAAAVDANVFVTSAHCVRTLDASQWRARVENETIAVQSLERYDNKSVVTIRLQRPPLAIARPFVLSTDASVSSSFTVVRVDPTTDEIAFVRNVSRLPQETCGLAVDASSTALLCVDIPYHATHRYHSLLVDAKTQTTLYGFSLLSSSRSSSNASVFEGIQRDDTTDDGVPTMDTYVLKPENDGMPPLTAAPSFMAGLRLAKDGASFCGGSLVSSSVVLTAAHCIDTTRVPAFVSIGSLATAGNDPQAEQLAVASVRLHPQFDAATKAHDLALVSLKEPSRFTPVRLENRHRLSTVRATVYGYGVTQADATELSPTLRSVELPLVLSRAQCEAQFGAQIDASFLCAGGEQGRDACTGDSGGPLVLATDASSPSLLAVVSAGDGCGVQGRPGLYTWLGSASAVAFISMLVPDAQWTASVRINGVSVPVVPAKDVEAVVYPQFVDASGSTSPSPTVGPGTVTPGGSATSTEQRDHSSSSSSSSSSSKPSPTSLMFRVEFGGEDLTAFTRSTLLQFLVHGDTNTTSSSVATETSSTTRVVFTLLSTARLDTLVATIGRHDRLALHRRRERHFHGPAN